MAEYDVLKVLKEMENDETLSKDKDERALIVNTVIGLFSTF